MYIYIYISRDKLKTSDDKLKNKSDDKLKTSYDKLTCSDAVPGASSSSELDGERQQNPPPSACWIIPHSDSDVDLCEST